MRLSMTNKAEYPPKFAVLKMDSAIADLPKIPPVPAVQFKFVADILLLVYLRSKFIQACKFS